MAQDAFGGASDHNALTGLGVGHPHPQYLRTQDLPAPSPPLGATQTSVVEQLGAISETHTRSTTNTYTGGKLTRVVEAAGATTVRDTTLNYTGDLLTSTVELIGGKTITTTMAYTGTTLTGSTRTVA